MAAARIALLVLLLGTGQASADPAVIERWYTSLLAADRPALSALLADNALIRLNDLGIVQAKTEFIASMDEWQQAVAGSTIRHRIDGSENGVTSVTACYDFPANDILMQETFRIEARLIVENTQTAIAESCDGY